MVKKWSGDGTYYLPARQVEPYRLWFEFLKQAHRDPEIGVNYEHYEEWGNFWDQEFGDWWSGATWRSLFAVNAGVRVFDFDDTPSDDENALLVRLPLNKDPKHTLKDIEELLQQHEAGIRLGDANQGKFALSAGYERAFLKYLPKVRVMLRCYTYWLDNLDFKNTERTSKTAIDFYTWAKSRDDLILGRGYKYNRPDIPYAVGEFAKQLIANEKPDEDHKRAFKRYLQKARKIARNAAGGVFPGKY